MWEQKNTELFRNKTGQAIIIIRDVENKPAPYFIDDNRPDLTIPIIDFIDSPFYKDTKFYKELKIFIDSLRLDLSNLYANKSAVFLDIVANTDLSQFTPATILGNPANSNLIHSLGKCSGLVYNSIQNGTSGFIQTSGTITNLSWSFTPGLNVFLNGLNLSHSIPTTGFCQKIGIAKSSNTLFIDLSDPITL